MRTIMILAGVVCLFVFNGCQTARYVRQTAHQGVVAIPSNQGWPNHRQKAEELMASHFPAGYVIDSEQECVVGMETNQMIRGGDLSWTSGTVTQDKTEWRINYHSINSGKPQPADGQDGYGQVEGEKKTVHQAAHQQVLDKKP